MGEDSAATPSPSAIVSKSPSPLSSAYAAPLTSSAPLEGSHGAKDTPPSCTASPSASAAVVVVVRSSALGVRVGGNVARPLPSTLSAEAAAR